MKISYNWLKEFVDFNLSPKELSEIFTSVGLEVEGMEEYVSVPGGLDGLVIGQVNNVEPHPNADKLHLTKVDIGSGTDLNIVCGAPNVAVGQKVIVATIGTIIFPTKGESFQIKKAKIRGVESEGMICAEDEIGLGGSHDGILILREDAVMGSKVSEYFKIEKDTIIEIGLTPNRSDAHSHMGVARDLVAYLSANKNLPAKIKLPSVDHFKSDNNNYPVEVKIENTDACQRYSGITVSGIEVKESPEWLKNRLKSIGVNCINNVVDVTNFILHELGQPLHAFDADEIAGKKVIVKTLAAGTKFKTLDAQEKTLQENDLMICNAEEGMCIAGVFGGIKSGVKETTKNIFIESAYFNPSFIRKTSRHHGLKTDAASRFEKGCDPEITVYALKHAALMIKEICGGKISSEVVDVYPKNAEHAIIAMKYSHIDRLIGKKIEHNAIHNILQALEMLILEKNEDDFKVSVPPYRSDVIREVDVIEDILRIYGLNNVEVPAQLRTSVVYTQKPDPEEIQNLIANLLTSNGFYELFNNSISKSKYLTEAFDDESEKAIHLLNHLNTDLDILRTNMIVSGMEAIAYNKNRQQSDLNFFEFGKVYHKETLRQTHGDKQQVQGDEDVMLSLSKHEFVESPRLSLFLTGMSHSENWKLKQKPADFFQFKAFVGQVINRTGIEINTSRSVENKYFKYGLEYSALIPDSSPKGRREEYQHSGKIVVRFGSLSKSVLDIFDLQDEVFYADFNWAAVIEMVKKNKIKFSGLPKFPGTRRDLALIVEKSVAFYAIKDIAAKNGGKVLQHVNLFDIYESEEKLGAGKKSYAVSFDFLDQEKTVNDKDVDKIMDRLIGEYEKELNAVIRK